MPEGPNLSGIQHGSVLLVPSQYEPVCQGGQTSPEFNMSPRGPQLTLGINAKGNASIAATMRSLARTSILQWPRGTLFSKHVSSKITLLDHAQKKNERNYTLALLRGGSKPHPIYNIPWGVCLSLSLYSLSLPVYKYMRAGQTSPNTKYAKHKVTKCQSHA